MSRERAGTVLVALAIVLLVVPPAVSAVTAPDRTQGQPGAPVLVGAFGTADDGTVTQLSANGSVAWQYDGAVSYASVQRVNETHVVAGVQRQADADVRCGQFNAPCARTGFVIVNGSAAPPRSSYGWTFPVADGRNSEVHDVEMLPGGDIVFADMDRERIVRLDPATGNVVWEWNASQHYDRPDDYLRTDWLHINDVDRIGERRYLVSVRNANQLVIVEEGRGVVEVINEDRSTDTLFEQHNPQWLGDGRVLVADSENNRIVELQRQPSGEWTVAWELSGAGGQPFDWPRDADRLPNGNTLVTDTRNNRIVEVTQTGEIVWSRPAPTRQPYDTDLPGSEHDAAAVEPATATPPQRLEQPFHSVTLLYSAVRATVGLPWWYTSWDFLFALAGLVIGSVGLTALYNARRDSDADAGDGPTVRERAATAADWLRSDRDPTEDPDGAAGRLLLVLVAGLMIQATFRLWAILKPLDIVGMLAVLLVGAAAWQLLVFAAMDVDLQEHGHLVASAVLAILGLAVFVSATAAGLFKSFPTDSLLFTAYSADLALQGANPFTASMEGAFSWGGSTLRYATPTIDGSIVLEYSYPAGAFLALAPLVASPVPVRAGVALAAVGLGAVVAREAPAELALAAPAALMAGRNLVITGAGGVWDVVWALPFVWALREVYAERHARGGLALGIACAIKQTPWLAAPFIAVRQWRVGNRRGAVVGTAAAVAVFAAINAPWIAATPKAWLSSVVAPLGTGAPLVHQGIGLTVLTFAGVYALPTWWHGLAVAIAAAVGLLATALYPERVGYGVWLAPPALLWFHYRSLTSYFVVFLPIAVLAVLATQDRLRGAAIPWPWRERAAVEEQEVVAGD